MLLYSVRTFLFTQTHISYAFCPQNEWPFQRPLFLLAVNILASAFEHASYMLVSKPRPYITKYITFPFFNLHCKACLQKISGSCSRIMHFCYTVVINGETSFGHHTTDTLTKALTIFKNYYLDFSQPKLPTTVNYAQVGSVFSGWLCWPRQNDILSAGEGLATIWLFLAVTIL